MPSAQHTAQDSDDLASSGEAPVPGMILVWSGDQPQMIVFRLPPAGLVLGRELLGPAGRDDRISRMHARVRWTQRGFTVTDLGSRNGSYVDGQTVVDGEVPAPIGAVVRAGRTLVLLVEDVRRFEGASITVDGDIVAGPTLLATWRAAERAARTGETLLVTGESGAGKELVAQAFHKASGATGALVAVNCAAIPPTMAERLLFGTRRGAYSGADRDADGYLATADGGTIFLDEIAELDQAVQAKLLRVIETGELLPLGASKPVPLKLKIVAATLRDLRAEVGAKRFRDDLYYRIGRPEVTVPPLRARREEIPYLVARAAEGVQAHPSLIEACLLRPWPGNVRELLGEVRRAALAAKEDGKPQVRADDLDPRAGVSITSLGSMDRGPETIDMTRGPGSVTLPGRPTPLPELERIQEALRAHDGNVSAAARALGLHRNQIRRVLAKHPGIGTADAADGDERDDD